MGHSHLGTEKHHFAQVICHNAGIAAETLLDIGVDASFPSSGFASVNVRLEDVERHCKSPWTVLYSNGDMGLVRL